MAREVTTWWSIVRLETAKGVDSFQGYVSEDGKKVIPSSPAVGFRKAEVIGKECFPTELGAVVAGLKRLGSHLGNARERVRILEDLQRRLQAERTRLQGEDKADANPGV